MNGHSRGGIGAASDENAEGVETKRSMLGETFVQDITNPVGRHEQRVNSAVS